MSRQLSAFFGAHFLKRSITDLTIPYFIMCRKFSNPAFCFHVTEYAHMTLLKAACPTKSTLGTEQSTRFHTSRQKQGDPSNTVCQATCDVCRSNGSESPHGAFVLRRSTSLADCYDDASASFYQIVKDRLRYSYALLAGCVMHGCLYRPVITIPNGLLFVFSVEFCIVFAWQNALDRFTGLQAFFCGEWRRSCACLLNISSTMYAWKPDLNKALC